jgi:hypothetical protein
VRTPRHAPRPRLARRAVLSFTTVAVLVATTSAAAAAPQAMSIERSRKVYLSAVCAFNAQLTERAAVARTLEAAGTPLTVGSPMPAELRRTAPEYARLARRAYRTFADPPAPWPDTLQPNLAIATAYSAVLAQLTAAFDAATIPASPPTWDTVLAAHKVNVPILRAALGIAPGTDPCAGRSASGATAPQVPDWAI